MVARTILLLVVMAMGAGIIWIWRRLVVEMRTSKTLTDALVRSEARFRATFETELVGICELDVDNRIVKANSAMCRIFGYAEEVIIGLGPAELTHPDDGYLSSKTVIQYLDGEIDHLEQEKSYVHRDGHRIWTSLDSNRMRDVDGEAFGAISHITEITNFKNE